MTNIAITPDLKKDILDIDFKFSRNIVDGITVEDNEIMGGEYSDFGPYLANSIKGFGNGMLASRFTGPVEVELLSYLDEITEWYGERKELFGLAYYPQVGKDEILNQLIENGFRFRESNSYWVKSVSKEKNYETFPEIKQVTEETSIIHQDTLLEAVGVELNNTQNHPFRIWLRSSQNYQNDSHLLYYINNKPVATGTIHVEGKFGLLCNAATKNEYRGQKLQQKMLSHRLNLAVNRGAEYAIVVTDVDSTSGRNMERMGFQKVYDVLYLTKKFSSEQIKN